MFQKSKDEIQQINQYTDMVSLVSQFIPLRKVGSLYKCACPFHEDHDPSFTVYEHSAYCFGCSRYFGPIEFIKEMQNLSYWGAVEWIQTRQGLTPIQFPRKKEEYTTPIDPSIIEYWHSMVDREYHHSRGINDDTIDFYKLGWDGQHHIIPVWEGLPSQSDVINIRLRWDKQPKYLNLKGRGYPKLFNKWILGLTDWVIVFIGEYDAILGTQDGLPCISGTAGQNSWLPEWTQLLSKKKRVFIVPDKGEEASGYNIASGLLGKARVCKFRFYKDYTEFRTEGDVSDFFHYILEEQYDVQRYIK